MSDVLTDLRGVSAAGGLSYDAQNVLDRTIKEIEHLRRQRDDLHATGNRYLDEARAERAARLGRPVVPCMRVGEHDLALPAYAHPDDVGADLRANLLGQVRLETPTRAWRTIITDPRLIRLQPGARVIIPCGFAFAIPDGYEGQVRPRSSTSRRGAHAGAAGWHDGAWVSLGSIDRGFRGEVGITLWHLGDEPFQIAHGDRVAQLVVSPVASAQFPLVDSLPTSSRGTGGYGSSGVK